MLISHPHRLSYANILPTLTHSTNEALDLPETAKTAEAAQYRVSNLHKINTALPTSGLLLWMTGVVM